MSKTTEEIKKYILYSIENIEPVDEKEIRDKKKIKNFLVLHPQNFYDTSNYRGHITASAMIMNENLILLHKRSDTKEWDVLKYHCEEGKLPPETVMDKIRIINGLADIKPKYNDEEKNPVAYHCDVYEIDVTPDDPTDKNHIHFDLLYIFETKTMELPADDKQLKWWSKNEAAKLNNRVRKVIMKQMGKIII